MSVDEIRIVLIDPQHSGNIGAVARAMKTMGLRPYLVRTSEFPSYEAERRAPGSTDILERAIVSDDAAEAVRDCQPVIGGSARTRWSTRASPPACSSLCRGGARVLVMGDFNTAHREIDLARPKDNRNTSGFLPEECCEIDRWVQAGWTDTYRHFDPGPDRYTWWSQRFEVRMKNIGWRLDYVLASPRR